MADRITRKFLEALGVPEAAIEAIIDAYRGAIDPVNDENKALKKQLESIDTSKDWKSEFEKATSALEAYKKDVADKDAKRAKEAAYRGILQEAGIDAETIGDLMLISGATIDKLELDKEGKAKNAADFVTDAKTKWKRFIPTTVTVGANIPHPPVTGGKTPTMTKDEIMAIKDVEARQKAMNENFELFKNA